MLFGILFFLNDPATTEIYTLSLYDALPISFSWRAIRRRLAANQGAIPKWMNVVRAVSSEGFGRIKYHTRVRGLLESDPRSEEHTSELQSQSNLVCRLLLEKKNQNKIHSMEI